MNRTHDPWGTAFTSAAQFEKLGTKEFYGDDIQVGRSYRTNKRSRGSVEDTVEGEENDVAGGFCQPAKLAHFVRTSSSFSIPLTDSYESNKKKVLDQRSTTQSLIYSGDNLLSKLDQKPQKTRSFEDVCSRQICRTWLKNTYLSLGNACPGTCLRMHTIPLGKNSGDNSNLQHLVESALYKDFSFKGLSLKQRKSIISKVISELGEAAGNALAPAESSNTGQDTTLRSLAKPPQGMLELSGQTLSSDSSHCSSQNKKRTVSATLDVLNGTANSEKRERMAKTNENDVDKERKRDKRMKKKKRQKADPSVK